MVAPRVRASVGLRDDGQPVLAIGTQKMYPEGLLGYLALGYRLGS